SMWGCGEGGEIAPVHPYADGSYSVEGLGTGDYIVIVNEIDAGHMPTGNTAMESEIVYVANGQPTPLNIDLSEPLTVTGSITDTGGILGVHNVVAIAVPIQFAMGEDIEAGMIMAPVTDNTFELKVAPGTYIITLGSEDVDFACEQVFKVVSEDTDMALTVEEGNTATVTINFPSALSNGADSCKWLGGIQLFKGEQPVGEWTGVVVGTSNWDDEDIELADGATSAVIPFDNLLDGEYTVRFFSDEFIMGRVNLTVTGTDVNATMALSKGATIQGKVVDADTGTKITDATIQCEAIPHVEGSFKSTEWAGPEGAFDENGVFHLRNLPEGTYLLNVTYEGGSSSNLNYAAVSMFGITLTGENTTDVGTIKLKKGSTISGRVTNSIGEGLPNIEVEAEFMDEKYGEILLESTTDPDGYYTIKGVDPDVAYYEVDAGIRPDPWEMMMQPCGYGEEMKLNITPGSQNVDFVLYETTASLTGTITKPAESTAFAPPFNDEGMDFPVAFIVMQKKGVPVSDPMDGIEAMSNPSKGDSTTYLVDNLVPGTYKVSVYSNGLCTYVNNSLEIQAGSNTLDITLTEGATVSGTVTKPDGTHPTTTDIEEVVAMNASQELVFGTFTKDPATGGILSYEIKGLKTGAEYHVALVSPGNEGPGDIYVQATTVTPNAATDSFPLNAVMAETAPTFMMTATKAGSAVNISIFSTAHLMDATADDMVEKADANTGIISNALLSPDKMMISFTYTPATDESSLAFTLTAHYGADYTQAQASYTIDLTVDGANQGMVNNFMGGKVGMGGGDASGICFEPGDIEDDGDGKTVVDVTNSEVGAGGESVAGSIFAAGVVIAPEATDALPSWATAVSKQYDFEIGADAIADGQSVSVTLQYTGSDTDNLHVLHYTGGAWQVEATNPSIDTINKTISVDVTSLSPFVAATGTEPGDDSGSTPLYSGGSSGGGCFVETACSTGGIAGMLLPLLLMIPLVKTRRRK
ncbi:MAG: hypothetical protein U9P49_13925, partial [Thermodesulfobacteriota bacterium]|nr:hypothetical protein [Thermodesulfobacteriota bacterium]